MEPKGAAEKEAKEQLTTVSGMGDERGRLEMSTVGQTVFRLFFMFSELYTIWNYFSNLYTENYVAGRPAACNFSGISFVWFS